MNDWPLRSFLELGALPTAVGCARLHTKQVLWEWGLSDLTDDVILIVSELVTNSLRAVEDMERNRPGQPAHVPCIELGLFSDKERVLVEVWDENPRAPELRGLDTDEEGGRGLFLVDTLSQEWGFYPTPAVARIESAASQRRPYESILIEPRSLRAVGKVVWAVVAENCTCRPT